jgi:hypothetical protein
VSIVPGRSAAGWAAIITRREDCNAEDGIIRYGVIVAMHRSNVGSAMPLHLDAGVEPIAGYRLVRLLGRGGFGEVREAEAPGGVHVALKFIRLDSHAAGRKQ